MLNQFINNVKTLFTKNIATENQNLGALATSRSISTTLNNNNQYKNWVYVAVSTRAKRVAEIEYELFKNGEEVKDHDLLKVLDTLDVEAYQSYLDLRGNVYIYIARYLKGNQPAALYVLNPDFITPVINKANPMEVVEYKIKGASTNIPATEIIHISNFNPNRFYPYFGLGMSILSAISSSILGDELSRKWNANFFNNAARPDGFLTTEQDLSAEEVEQLTKNFLDRYGGVDNAHTIGFLGAGMKFVPLSLNQKDIDFIEQTRMSRDEILSAFGIPKSEVGLVEDVNRANAEASSYVFAKNTIDPLMRKLIKSLRVLLSEYKGEKLILKHKSVVPEDRAQLLAERVAGVDKWISRNEIRRADGLVEVEGGDELYQQFTLTPINSNPKKSLPIKDIKPDFKGLLKTLKTLEAKKKIDKEVIAKTWLTIFKAYEGKLEKDISKYFSSQEEAVLKILNKSEKSFNIDIIKSALAKEWEGQIALGVSFITPRIMDYILSGAKNGAESIGYDEAFDERAKNVRDFVKSRAEYFSTSINETTKDKLLSSLADGIEAGESKTDMIDRIKGIFAEATDSRAKTIARTEISAAANFGKMELYQQADIKYWEWVVVNPEDEDCLDNEGEVVKIGEPFRSGDINSPIHPNCQCTTSPVFD